MSHTCSGAGGPWLIYKSSVFGWVAEWHKSVSKWLPPSSWLRGHDTRMGEPLIHSQKNGLKPIIVFNNDTIQSYMLWEQCCKSWRRPDDLKYLIILCLLGRWRRWSKWWRKGAREWWWLWLDHRTILPPHLCQLLTILCSGFQIDLVACTFVCICTYTHVWSSLSFLFGFILHKCIHTGYSEACFFPTCYMYHVLELFFDTSIKTFFQGILQNIKFFEQKNQRAFPLRKVICI